MREHTPWRVRAAGAAGTHSLASSIVDLVFCIVSFAFASLMLTKDAHACAMCDHSCAPIASTGPYAAALLGTAA